MSVTTGFGAKVERVNALLNNNLLQPGLEFEPASHTYKLNGRWLVSVTQVIKPLIDSQWFGKDAGWNGRCKHKMHELEELGALDEDLLDKDILPALQAWRRFKEKMEWSTLAVELKLAHEKFQYAGTIDNFGILDGLPTILDIKTGSSRHSWWALQLAGYDELIRHCAKLIGLDHIDLQHLQRRVLRLNSDAWHLTNTDNSITMIPYLQARDLFFSALKLEQFRRRNNGNA
jgi:hypothetical protein